MLILLERAFLDGSALGRESEKAAEVALGNSWDIAGSGTTTSTEVAFSAAAGRASPCALLSFFTHCACCADAGSGLSVLFRLILFMKFGISSMGIGLGLCSVAFSMILSQGDSVLHARRNMDCMMMDEKAA